MYKILLQFLLVCYKSIDVQMQQIWHVITLQHTISQEKRKGEGGRGGRSGRGYTCLVMNTYFWGCMKLPVMMKKEALEGPQLAVWVKGKEATGSWGRYIKISKWRCERKGEVRREGEVGGRKQYLLVGLENMDSILRDAQPQLLGKVET